MATTFDKANRSAEKIKRLISDPIITFNHMEDPSSEKNTSVMGSQSLPATRYFYLELLLIATLAVVMFYWFL